ncbi:MAG: hypothetical protein ACO3PJ_07670 [Burkholderiaceae bacterium]
MSEVASSQVVKSIGASGQISLGKEFAGRQVLVDSPAEGVWFIKAVKVVPDHEAWVDEPKDIDHMHVPMLAFVHLISWWINIGR